MELIVIILMIFDGNFEDLEDREVLEIIKNMYSETALAIFVDIFLNEKGLDVDTVEILPRNEELDLVAEFAQWITDCIKAQCEKEKGRSANG